MQRVKLPLSIDTDTCWGHWRNAVQAVEIPNWNMWRRSHISFYLLLLTHLAPWIKQEETDPHNEIHTSGYQVIEPLHPDLGEQQMYISMIVWITPLERIFLDLKKIHTYIKEVLWGHLIIHNPLRQLCSTEMIPRESSICGLSAIGGKSTVSAKTLAMEFLLGRGQTELQPGCI